MRKLHICITICTILILGSILWITLNRNPLVYGLDSSNQKVRIQTLGHLIRANHLKGQLPIQFDLGIVTENVEVYKSADRNGHVYRLVRLITSIYPDNPEYSFVFNAKGICLLSTPNWALVDNGGLYDINQDGQVEYIVTYAFNSCLPEHLLKNKGNYLCVTQIWKMEVSKANLLLEVHYDNLDMKGDTIITLQQKYLSNSLLTEFALEGNSEIARIYWDKIRDCFSVKGDDSGQWKQIFPQKEE